MRGDAIFLLFEVYLADVDIFYSDSLSRNLTFNCFMFMPEISNWMVFVNGKHPRTPTAPVKTGSSVLRGPYNIASPVEKTFLLCKMTGWLPD